MGKQLKNRTFVDYYDEWLQVYKVGMIAEVTLNKYKAIKKFLVNNFSEITIGDLDRRMYQTILNKYAETHEKQTTMDFHRQVKASIQDLFYEGLIERDPTYKAVIKGRAPITKKKNKFLQVEELKKLIRNLNISDEINMDWFILLLAKTGARFSEMLAVTPKDFDFKAGTLVIDKTWGYKNRTNPCFMPTKNRGSRRTIQIDLQITEQFAPMIKDLPEDEPIFVNKNDNGKYSQIFNSTYNAFLTQNCVEAGIEKITIHGLRHTHASVLLATGMSIHSISKRLGHSNVSTTQEVYAHILDMLAEKDNEIMMQALMSIA